MTSLSFVFHINKELCIPEFKRAGAAGGAKIELLMLSLLSPKTIL